MTVTFVRERVLIYLQRCVQPADSFHIANVLKTHRDTILRACQKLRLEDLVRGFEGTRMLYSLTPAGHLEAGKAEIRFGHLVPPVTPPSETSPVAKETVFDKDLGYIERDVESVNQSYAATEPANAVGAARLVVIEQELLLLKQEYQDILRALIESENG